MYSLNYKMSSFINIGIVGVSGLVGKEILKSIEMLKLEFPINYFMYGTIKSAGKFIQLNGNTYEIEEFKLNSLDKLDYCILAVDNTTSKEIANYIYQKNINCKFIDNSSEFRMCNEIPLVVKEINSNKITKNSNFVASPNCSTTMLVMLLKPLQDLNIKRVVVSTYQAASGAGIKGLDELNLQTVEYVKDEKITTKTFWKKQYLFNAFSHNSRIDPSSLYNEEELKMIFETQKILSQTFEISPTCIRIPTLRSHMLSVNVEFDKEVNYSNIIEKLNSFTGILIVDDIENNEFPEPVKSSGDPLVHIGRIRSDLNNLTKWNFIVCGDQLLKGSAYNSVQILIEMLNISK